jgi:hypothetical protein
MVSLSWPVSLAAIEMQVVAHDHVTEQSKTLFLLAMADAVNEDFSVGLISKKVNPFHHGESEEMRAFGITNAVRRHKAKVVNCLQRVAVTLRATSGDHNWHYRLVRWLVALRYCL